MSTSPTPAQSTKRPLEEPSSPSGPTDQPDAKRPALDKIMKEDSDETKPAVGSAEEPDAISEVETMIEDGKGTNGVKHEVTDAQGDTVVEDAQNIHAIESTVPSTRGQNSSGNLPHDESGWIHIRSVISSPEAATVIGKGGENVTQIRKLSGAKCTVSDYQKGAVERILTVSGLVDAVAKVCLPIWSPVARCN